MAYLGMRLFICLYVPKFHVAYEEQDRRRIASISMQGYISTRTFARNGLLNQHKKQEGIPYSLAEVGASTLLATFHVLFKISLSSRHAIRVISSPQEQHRK